LFAFFNPIVIINGHMIIQVQGSRFKVQGSRFKVQGSRFKVQGARGKGQARLTRKKVHQKR
jgi:hypothetical protein